MVGDVPARINAIVEYIVSKPALRQRAGIVGEISATDVQQIQDVVKASESEHLLMSDVAQR